MNWQKQTIKIVKRDSVPVLIDAIVFDCFAIHECIDRFLPESKRNTITSKYQHDVRYTVTHIPTSCQITTCNTINICQRFIKEVADMPWHLVTTRLKKMPKEFDKQKFRNAVLAYSCGRGY